MRYIIYVVFYIMQFKSKIFMIIALGAMALVAFVTLNNGKEKIIMNNANYTEVHAKHILVDSEKQANEILQDINDKKISFDEAAQKYSKCPSGKSCGDLGFFKRGMMVKEFEDSAFSLEKGSISSPVQTQFGWHLIEGVDNK